MLKQRIITAAWLAPLVLAGFFGLEGGAFALFAAAVVLLGGWEWTNLAGLSSLRHRGLAVAALALVLLALWLTGAGTAVWPLVVGALGWMANGYWVSRYPADSTRWDTTPLQLCMGLWVLVPCWVGFNALRESEPGGIWLLFVLLVVWAADIGAYFAGRAFGRRKLAPGVSPGKSWEGVFGGMAATALVALGFGVWQLAAVAPTIALLMATAGVTLVSVLGDLLESMLKRQRGIKDASAILPGHGGVLDRIDSLTAAVPIFALLYLQVLPI